MGCTCTYFKIDGLKQRTALRVPIILESQNNFLKTLHERHSSRLEPRPIGLAGLANSLPYLRPEANHQ